MRKVPLSMILPHMKLAMPIYHKNQLLLTEGTKNLNRYVNNLLQLGITSVYIDDKLSEGIEVPDLVSEKARFRCKDVLNGALENLKINGVFSEVSILDSIDELLDDIVSRKDILISLNDIGTTDDSTLVHSVNMTVFSLLMGKKLNFNKSQLKKLAEGCILHDIGKVLINPAILYKPSSLTKEEFEYVKQHTVLGYNIAKKNPILTELSRIICLSHHERLDGSGYPQGLKGEEIHPFVRIASVADVYDALISRRCYHDEKSNYEAVNILTEQATEKLDSDCVSILIKNVAVYPNGSMIKLSDGNYAIVKEQNIGMPMHPIVRVFQPKSQQALYELDLTKELSITIVDPNVTSIDKTE